MRTSRHFQLGIWRRLVIGGLAIGAIIFLALLLLIPITKKDRYTVVLATNPVSLITVETTTNTTALIQIPQLTTIEAAHSIGRYPVASLWKMGLLDQSDRALFAESVGIAFGTPIVGYIGTSGNELDVKNNPYDIIKSYFSFSGLAMIIGGQHITNISFPTLFTLTKIFMSMNLADIRVIDIQKLQAMYKEMLPDDTSRDVLDVLKIDVLLKNIFTVQTVRKEALSIAIQNTTHVPDLAGNMARQFTNSGLYVVSVENAENRVSQCQIVGPNKSLQSKTARYIAQIYHCITLVSDVPQREDLIVRIGMDIATQYIPKNH